MRIMDSDLGSHNTVKETHLLLMIAPERCLFYSLFHIIVTRPPNILDAFRMVVLLLTYRNRTHQILFAFDAMGEPCCA
jgi:hypothetical protein